MDGMTLKHAREALGWSQIKLDAQAGLPKGTVHDIESGRNDSPRWTVVAAITAALQRAGLKGVTAHSLFPVEHHASR
jgi:DNA-binding XRE family transcriptional regulator